MFLVIVKYFKLKYSQEIFDTSNTAESVDAEE